jgi:8-oxo-dGTP diphosphatase
MRRYGETREAGRRYTYRPGIYAILPRDGQLLLTHQQEPEPEIQLPGGGIDPGEPALPALYREVLEETGWRVGGARRLGAYRRFTYMPEYDLWAENDLWAEKVCQIYVAFPVRSLGPPTEDGHTALWASPEVAVETVASPGDREYLMRWLAGEFG